MKHFRHLTALTIALFLGSATFAQDDVPDDIDAKTPTDLIELLPEGGIEKTDVDFWLVMEMQGPGGVDGQESMYMHWSIKPEDGKLVVQIQQGSGDEDGDGAFGMHKRTVYSAKGRLESFRSEMSFGGFGGQTATGQVEGDELVITTEDAADLALPDGVEIEPAEGDGPQTRRVPLKDVEAIITPELMPLVFGYHARQGSLSYRVPMGDPASEMGEAGTMTVEDMGQEAVEFDGKEHTAHLLSVKMVQRLGEDGESFEQAMRMLVLKDGTIMKMYADQDQIKMTAERMPFEQVKEKFNLNDDGSPKAHEAGDEDAGDDVVEEAGEAIEEAADEIGEAIEEAEE
jgi:hypothetical protein